LFDVNFQPKEMAVSELESGFRTLAAQLYSKESVRTRQLDFFARIRSHEARNRNDDQARKEPLCN
jgi:hypothetical protein